MTGSVNLSLIHKLRSGRTVPVNQRRTDLLKHAEGIGCDSLVVLEPENLFYLTGFWGEAAAVFESDGAVTIIAPELEMARAKEEAHDCTVVRAERGSGMVSTLAGHVRGKAPCTDCQDYASMVSLKDCVPNIRQSDAPFYSSRMVKDRREVAILKKASRIIDELFEVCAQSMHAGQKESDLQAVIMADACQRQMFDTGYPSTLNPLIIAGGPNGALPHAQVTQRKFRRGDLVVVDLTLRYKGYVSDATRTFAVGQVRPRQAEAYDVVRESQRLGLKSVRPGVPCSDVDESCRRHIKDSGFGQYFIHSTGHGIGLEVHEPPAVSAGAKTELKKNMAITVEPGIYIGGSFGIRIEDSLMVGDRAATVMHKFTKDLIVV